MLESIRLSTVSTLPTMTGYLALRRAVARAKQPAVRPLAQSIVDAQTSEIELMQGLLQQKGFPPHPMSPA